jgi:hypothetical protein
MMNPGLYGKFYFLRFSPTNKTHPRPKRSTDVVPNPTTASSGVMDRVIGDGAGMIAGRLFVDNASYIPYPNRAISVVATIPVAIDPAGSSLKEASHLAFLDAFFPDATSSALGRPACASLALRATVSASGTPAALASTPDGIFILSFAIWGLYLIKKVNVNYGTLYPIWIEVRTYVASIDPTEKTVLILAFSKFKEEEKK